MNEKCKLKFDENGHFSGRDDKRTLGDLMLMNNNGTEYTKCTFKGRTWSVHEIIGKYLFQGVPSNFVVHHIDGNKKNNNPNNLTMLSPSEHAKSHGTGKWMLGKKAAKSTIEKHRAHMKTRERDKRGRLI